MEGITNAITTDFFRDNFCKFHTPQLALFELFIKTEIILSHTYFVLKCIPGLYKKSLNDKNNYTFFLSPSRKTKQ